MLAMLRVLSRSALFRSCSATLESRTPDDVWFDKRSRWFIVFRVRVIDGDDVLVFVLERSSQEFKVVGAKRVRRTPDGQVTVADGLSPHEEASRMAATT